MTTVTLGSLLASLESGARPKGGVSTDGDGVPSIGGEHLGADGGFRLESIKFVPKDFFDGMAKGRIAVDDILVVKDGATTGKTSFVGPDFPYPVAAVNEHVFVLRVDRRKAWPKYVFHYLLSAQGQADIRKDFRGATVGGISRGFVDLVRLRSPPLPEQKRIAAILDAADALRAKRRESIEQLDSLVQATFLDMFGDPVTNPKGWKTCSLPQLVKSGDHPLKRGPFGGALKKEIFVDRGYKVYQQQNVIYQDFEAGNYFIGDRDYERLRAFAVSPGDLLVSCSGTIGRIAEVPAWASPGVMNQALLKITLEGSRCVTAFFLALWRSEPFSRQVLGMTHGTGMKNMKSMSELKRIDFITPRLDLQTRFASIVEAIEQQKARLKAHLAELDALFASLQSRAFNGELVA